MILIVSGTRNELTDKHKEIIRYQLASLEDQIETFAVGDCPTGVDAFASHWAIENGHDPLEFIADWDDLGKAAGPIRNQRMIDWATSPRKATYRKLLVAFPAPDSVGTFDCIARASKVGIPFVSTMLD